MSTADAQGAFVSLTPPTPVESFLTQTQESLVARLADFGITLPTDGAVAAVHAWVLDEAAGEETFEQAVARLDAEDVADQMATYMLSQIAEERPGTDPFAHERTIPLPVPIVTRVLNSLGIGAEISLINGDADRARGFVAAICSLSGLLTTLLVEGDVTDEAVTLDTGDGRITFPGPLVRLPQPGLAYCARMLSAVAECLEDGDYAMTQHVDEESQARLIRALLSDAAGIRRFTSHFGTDPNPTARS